MTIDLKSIQPFGLYPVLTEEFCLGRSSEEVLVDLLKAKIKIVQLREKTLSKNDLLLKSKIFRELTLKHGCILIINDHIDVALAAGADGVHLGQDDLPCEYARKIAPHLIIGISTHTYEDIDQAISSGASYINVGPVFSTQTKETTVDPLGMKYLQEVKNKINIPFTVMGGIKKRHLNELVKLGVRNVGMVTEVTQAKDITQKANDIQKTLLSTQ